MLAEALPAQYFHTVDVVDGIVKCAAYARRIQANTCSHTSHPSSISQAHA